MKQNEIIYQIFPRNHSQNEPFKSIIKDLPRIKKLGVDIIYLMPIHIIGEKARKGTFGSPYAIKDYFSISPDLGNKDDFSDLVNKTHELGMKIILDMVFNHTSPDNVLLKDHEDYYFHKNGKLGNRVGDWSDIVDLDNNKEETQNYLLSVLKYWVSLGVNGFRFDVASMIPLSFFKKARKELGKEIIFIGESIDKDFSKHLKDIGDYVTDDKDMYPTFDSLYNYNYYHYLKRYFNGEDLLGKIVDELNEDKNNLRMLCLENHDVDRIASILDKGRLSRVLDFFSFIKGQAFIYEGQEFGNKHLPMLFEKDVIDFSYKDKEIENMYIAYIKNKRNQKTIIDTSFELVDENTITVKNVYDDGLIEQKAFYLG